MSTVRYVTGKKNSEAKTAYDFSVEKLKVHKDPFTAVDIGLSFCALLIFNL